MLDFKELGSSGLEFELLLRELIFSLGHNVHWSGVGPDGGRDLLVRRPSTSEFGEFPETWLVQCKHFAHSGRAVGVNDIDNILDSCSQHAADGYLLASSTYVSSSLVDRLEAINSDRSKHLKTSFWDSSKIEHLLDSPENWAIAQRFFPVSAKLDGWQVSQTTRPNQWIVNFQGHHIYLSNRIGSHYTHHKGSIKHRIDDIARLELPKDCFIRIRSVYYDDKGGAYLYSLDVMRPFDCSQEIDVESLRQHLGEDYALEDGQLYNFDIRVVKYYPASDHYDENHYDYYVPYMGSFLVGEPRFDRGEFLRSHSSVKTFVSVHDRLSTAAVRRGFEELESALKEVPFITYVRGENANFEAMEVVKSADEFKALLADVGFHQERLDSVLYVFDVTDKKKLIEMLSQLRQDISPGFSIMENIVFVPSDDGTASKYVDEALHFLTIRIWFEGDVARTRNTLNMYLSECAQRIRKFIARNR